ncbi:MAG: hypothetical protein JSR83_01810 [Proteobacteria bacterium]|nr:hypothetical protein [Pseudomonadota bacterium]
MKLATLKKDTYFVDRYGEWVAVRAGAVIQVEEQRNGEYMLHAPGGLILLIGDYRIHDVVEVVE